MPLSLAWLPHAMITLEPPVVSALGVGLYAADLAMIALAYRMDRERARELALVPVQRLLFPAFMCVVFAVARIAARVPPRWSRAARA